MEKSELWKHCRMWIPKDTTGLESKVEIFKSQVLLQGLQPGACAFKCQLTWDLIYYTHTGRLEAPHCQEIGSSPANHFQIMEQSCDHVQQLTNNSCFLFIFYKMLSYFYLEMYYSNVA